MREWFLSTELVGLRGMANSASGVAQKARRNNWLSRNAKSGGRALEYHISNFHPDVKKQLIEKYVTDPNEAKLLMVLTEPVSEFAIDESNIESVLEHLAPTTGHYLQRAGRASRRSENVPDLEVVESDSEKRDVSYVTYYDISASAGAGRLVEYEPNKRIELSETLRLALNIQAPSHAKLLNMEGDSMHPTLKDKSILAIEELETFKQDGVYVFTFDSTLYVKRLQKSREGIKVISDNPIYDAWFINRDEVDTSIFTIHGRVTGCAQSV